MRDRRSILIAVGGVTGGVLVLAALVVLLLAPRLGLPGAGGASPTPGPRWAAAAAAPVPAVDPPAGSGVAGLVSADWSARTSAATGIPQRALEAYAGVALLKARDNPECRIGWNTLAAIGAAESDHGRHGGSTIGSDGTATPPIYGVALDGNGTALIPDSDGGAIDGDPTSDRAVGPMQLIPQTWRNWHIDGNSDNVEDPQNIDDATFATANYLCHAASALDTESGWRTAISAYNSAPSYLAIVARFGTAYAADAG